MAKIKKEDSRKFADSICLKLKELGAEREEDKPYATMIDHVLETPLGQMNVHVATDNIGCYTVFGRFEDVERAKRHLDCNPFSGKYNLHIGGPKVPVDEVIGTAERWLDKIMRIEE